jgi:16S rRNA (cytosine1402-N4)-methyltransferase
MVDVMVAFRASMHISVLLAETIAALAPKTGDWLVDGTLGGGGHTAAILATGADVLALDWDKAAVDAAEQHFIGTPEGARLVAQHAGFGELARIVAQEASARGKPCAGVLLDLGFSSDQLDDAGRGLSYLHDGPLDMRLDSRRTLTAAEVLNTWREEDLADVLFKFGEEPKSRHIARAVVRARKLKPLSTTFDFRAVIEQVYPFKARGKGNTTARRAHPAARVFQALRVLVNDEMGQLAAALPAAAAALAVDGRLAVITFQPLEDRMVKQVFRSLVKVPEDAVGRQIGKAGFKVWPKIVPTKAELAANPRARSAKLRVLEKVLEKDLVES